MQAFTYVITDPVGIHARPAGLLVQEAKKYSSTLTLESKGKKADLKRIFALMSLGVKQNNTVTVTAEGSDEIAAAAALQTFLTKNL